MAEQYVGIDLHRRRSVIVRMTGEGQVLETVRIDNDPVALSLELAKAGPDPEVVLEATYGWYWAADLLQACGARVHLAHPLGIKMFGYQRVKTDARDSTNLAELLRMGRLPKAWLAPPAVRELRELVRYRAKLVAAGGAAQRPEGAGPRRARQAGCAGADERLVRGGRHPAAGGAAAGARLRVAGGLAPRPPRRL
jgi:serine/threonine protein kinase HipA of HipAB toxin-antitoxin module